MTTDISAGHKGPDTMKWTSYFVPTSKQQNSKQQNKPPRDICTDLTFGVDMAWRDITLIFGHWTDRSVAITPRWTQAVTPGNAVGRGLEIPAGSPGRGRTGGTFGTMSEQFVSRLTVFSRFTRSGLANGRRRAGLPTMIGGVLGLTVYASTASVGMSALPRASATAFAVLKVVASVYLVWVDLQTLRTAQRSTGEATPERRRARRSVLRHVRASGWRQPGGR